MTTIVNNLSHSLKPNAAAPTVTKTVTNSATTLASLGVTLHANTKAVQIAVESAPVRVCPEGTPATTALGQPIAAGQIVLMDISEATLASFIRSTAVDATIQVSQYCI